MNQSVLNQVTLDFINGREYSLDLLSFIKEFRYVDLIYSESLQIAVNARINLN